MIGDAAGSSSTKAELKIVAGARWEIAEIEPKHAVTIFATRVSRMIIPRIEGPTYLCLALGYMGPVLLAGFAMTPVIRSWEADQVACLFRGHSRHFNRGPITSGLLR